MLGRAVCAIVAISCLVWADRVAAQVSPEFDAEIFGENVFAYSGPGTIYYPTNRLFRGERVTVYGKPVGDYLQVLPPRGRSFSWIRAKDVEERNDGRAVVRNDASEVYVGSELSPNARWVRQVRLKKDTLVGVIDHVLVGEGPQAEDWVKILPPTDEVRYVLAKHIRRPGEVTSIQKNEPTPTKTESTSESRQRPSARPQPTEMPRRAAFSRQDTIPAAVPVSGLKFTEEQVTENQRKRISEADDIVSTELKKLSTEIDHLGHRLPETWNLPAIEAKLRDVRTKASPAQQANVAALEDSVKRLRDRGRRIEDIRSRWKQFLQKDAEQAQQIERVLSQTTSLRPNEGIQGTLRATKRILAGRPMFELTDKTGQVTHILIPPAGLSLDKYINRQIGVLGKQETVSSVSKQPVIRVEQVVPVDAQ